MRKYQSIIIGIIFLTTVLINNSIISLSKETGYKSDVKEKKADHVVYIGSIKVTPDPDGEEGVNISIITPGRIKPVYFNFGETIRMYVNWSFKESSSDKEQWYFAIPWMRASGYWYIILPENDDFEITINDTLGKTDEGSGQIYFDFTPNREWFPSAWHNLGGDGDRIEIQLKCVYRHKPWIGGDWKERTEFGYNRNNWHLEYKNTPPTIEDYSISTEKLKVILQLKVRDPDWRHNSTQKYEELGDYIGVSIQWGDGTSTETGYWDKKWQIKKGETIVSISHTYNKRGSYTIKAKVKDWYNADFHDYSNEVKISVKISSSISNSLYKNILPLNHFKKKFTLDTKEILSYFIKRLFFNI